MADLTLKDGREVEIDLYQITIKEWRSLLDVSIPDEDEYALLARISGLDDVGELPYPDYRELTKAITDKARNPVSDPN